MYNDERVKEIRNLLNNPKKVVITTHRSPDGDAIGSSLGLFHYLKKIGHEVKVVTPDDYPDFLHWLPGHENVISHYNHQKEADELADKADLIFCLDFNSYNRLGSYEPHVRKSDAVKICIDHHRDPENFHDYGYIDITASSTSQLIYEFITELGDKEKIDKVMADCIYTGIVTDTGSFRFSSTSARTHEIAAEIIKLGSNVTEIQDLIYNNSSEDRLRLLGYAISSKLKVYTKYNAALISLTKEELDRFNYKTGDTEGIVNYALSIKGIKMAILITEKQGEARISMRSKGDFPVNELSKKYFNGGGHQNAAGGIAQLPIESVIEKFENILPEYEGTLF